MCERERWLKAYLVINTSIITHTNAHSLLAKFNLYYSAGPGYEIMQLAALAKAIITISQVISRELQEDASDLSQ